MTVKQDLLKKSLEEQRVRLQEQISQLTIGGQEHPGYGNHMADDASEVFEQAKNLALRQTLERQLEQVEEALERFGRGTYGYCLDCGEKIDYARLKAIPSASLCIECMERRERRR
ncbi:MAG TPA: conjugal transfer protein TraR [Chloroflexi bacterium]|nr:conjugal transfer protein TraR [Chloroflexota bacterium]